MSKTFKRGGDDRFENRRRRNERKDKRSNWGQNDIPSNRSYDRDNMLRTYDLQHTRDM